MRWTLAASGTPDDRAVLDVALWLRDRGGFEVRAVHVQTAGETMFAGCKESLDQLSDAIGSQVSIVTGTSAAGALLEHARRSGDALVMGCRCGRPAPRLARVGQVPRRVLQQTPTAVLLVPTGLGRLEMSGGPVLAAVRPTPDGVRAANTARDLAEQLHLPLLLGHIEPTEGNEVTSAEALRSALSEGGLGTVWPHTVRGAVPEALLDLAARCDPSLIVCGSRQTGTAPRANSSSFGTLVGAVSPVPVLVVPQ